MRILTSEQSARVIGGASAVTNSTLAADQLDDVQIDDQDSHGVVSKLHDNPLPLGAPNQACR